MPKMTGPKPYHCTVLGKRKVSCKASFVTLRGLTNHVQKKHPLTGANDFTSQELDELVTLNVNKSPNEEANIVADNILNTVILEIGESTKLPPSLIQVIPDHLDQGDVFVSEDLAPLLRVHSTHEMADFLTQAQAQLTVAPSVVACAEVASFYNEHPSQQASMDLMASQTIIVPDLLEESSDEEGGNDEPKPQEKTEIYTSEEVIERNKVDIPDKKQEDVKEPEPELESPVSCGECGKIFKTMNACYTHMNSDHVKEAEKVDAVYNCDSCGELFDTVSSGINHKKEAHEEPEKIEAVFNCDICGELFKTTSDGNNHMEKAHEVQTVENCGVKQTDKAKATKPYSCDNCSKTFIYSADHTVHQVEVHGIPGVSDKLKKKKKVQPYLVKLLAEQNIILAEEINELKELVEKQNVRMSTMFDIVRNLKTYEEFKKKVTTQEKTTETAAKPKESKNTKPETTTKHVSTKEPEPVVVVEAHTPEKTPTRITCPDCELTLDSKEAMQCHKKTIHKPKITIKTSETVSRGTERVLRQKNRKMETKIVGDSIVNQLNPKIVEDEIKGLVFLPGRSGGPGAQRDRAYGAKYESRKTGALYPNNNQRYKVPQLLKERMVDNLIMSVSVTDITNLNIVPKENMNFLHMKVQESVESTVKVATDALENNSELKVVIMAAPPRYDSLAELSEYGNLIVKTRVEEAKVKFGDRLQVGEHTSLYMEGDARGAIFGVPGLTKGYDGVHMRGVRGQEAYTNSVIEILKEAGVYQAKWKEARWKEAKGRRPIRRQEVKESQPKNITTSNMFSGLN